MFQNNVDTFKIRGAFFQITGSKCTSMPLIPLSEVSIAINASSLKNLPLLLIGTESGPTTSAPANTEPKSEVASSNAEKPRDAPAP